ncbi:type II CAAX endopeptidase family protein [Nesterenkonia ebinurensis]|uniref:type II CAAX endopeptidase family protein n=1 Tax=Nesterenkonia ebinurensis TaxID=2608252 RepID=UPI00123DF88C|nr:type II CAAX endopeptidase family protein [Nesterenkonia ebinurensis]
MSQQPPPVPNPYGPVPGERPARPPLSGPPPGWKPGDPLFGEQRPVTQAYSGPPPGRGRSPRKRQQDSDPGKFTWWDLGATLFYVVGFLTGLISFLVLLPPINTLMTGNEVQQQQGMFAINAISYGVLGAITLVLSAAALWRSIKAFAYLWWLKLLLVPFAWFATLLLNFVLIVVMLGADPQTSENQVAIDAMLQAVPFMAAVAVIAVLGPYVEEYFFRHLLIGKLSRYINVWICGAVSVIAFPLLHFIPALFGLADDLTLVAVVPYLTMGILITVGYIVTGRNLFYAWVLHFFNNFMSLLVSYFVLPWAEDFEQQYQGLFWLTSMIG